MAVAGAPRSQTGQQKAEVNGSFFSAKRSHYLIENKQNHKFPIGSEPQLSH
jgi:hypothetical protein